MNKLTCIITFRNEGKEVEATVKSIRNSIAGDVDILLVNDISNDDYDYESVAKAYNCDYVNSGKGLGVAGSRDLGVALCRTPYFVLLDGHMRFYQQGWDLKLIDALETHPNSIITSSSIAMWLNDDGTIDNEDGKNGMFEDPEWGVTWNPGKGCYINLMHEGHEFTSAWAHRAKNEEDDLIEIPSVMGAVYASSVEHWNYIKGLYMLRSYGNDEAFMAMKTWLLGGKCYILKKFGVGHLYRSRMPYNGYSSVDYAFNRVILAELFCDEETNQHKINTYENTKKMLNEQDYQKLLDLVDSLRSDIDEYRKYIREHQTMTLQEFLDNVNSYATPLN